MKLNHLHSKLAPTLALTLVIALSGCGGGGDASSTTSTQGESLTAGSIDQATLLEAAHGGADGLREFFDSHSEAEIRAELASYGIGYEVHATSTTQEQSAQAQSVQGESVAKPQAITDCVKFFPTADRTKWHNFSGEYYYIDSAGRPNKAYSDLPPINPEARQESCQTSIGQWGDVENPSNDYDGGHLIGSQLGGWGGRANIVPQDANFNRGNWAQLENKMAGCGSLPAGTMRYSINVGYPSSGVLVPSSFAMTLTKRSTGSSVTLNFTNVDYGGSNGTNERLRGVSFLSSNGCI